MGRNAREARVAPSDIDQTAAEALVRIMGGNQRTTLAITGSIARVRRFLTRAAEFQSAGDRRIMRFASLCR
jgi:hypothetical protein